MCFNTFFKLFAWKNQLRSLVVSIHRVSNFYFDSIIVRGVRSQFLEPRLVKMIRIATKRKRNLALSNAFHIEKILHIFQTHGDENAVGQIANAVDRSIQIERFHLRSEETKRISFRLSFVFTHPFDETIAKNTSIHRFAFSD